MPDPKKKKSLAKPKKTEEIEVMLASGEEVTLTVPLGSTPEEIAKFLVQIDGGPRPNIPSQAQPDSPIDPLSLEIGPGIGLTGRDIQKASETVIPPIQKFVQEETPTIVGGTIGAVTGFASPPGNIPGAIGGATLGAAGGEAGGQILRRIGIPIGRPVETSEQAAKEILFAGAAGAVGEAGGQLFAKAIGRFASKFLQVPETTVPLTQAETSGGTIASFIESVSERSLPGKFIFIPKRIAQQRELRKLGLAIVADVTSPNLTAEQAGKLFIDEIGEARALFNSAKNGLYSDIDKIAGNRIVRRVGQPSEVVGLTLNTAKISSTARRLIENVETFSLGKPNVEFKQVIRRLRAFADAPSSVSFETIRRERSTLLKLLRKNKDVLGPRSDQIVTALESVIDKEIDIQLARGGHTELLKKFRAANKFYREGIQDLNSSTIKQILAIADKGKSEAILSRIFDSGGLDEIRLVQKLSRTEQLQNIKSTWMKELLDSVTVDEPLFTGLDKIPGLRSDILPTINFKSLSTKLESMGADRLSVIFNSPGELAALNRFLEITKTIRAGGQGTKGAFPGLAALGVNGIILAPFLGFGGGAVAAGVSLGVVSSSLLLTNTNGLKLLTRALIEKPGTAAAGRLANQIMAQGAKLEAEFFAERFAKQRTLTKIPVIVP